MARRLLRDVRDDRATLRDGAAVPVDDQPVFAHLRFGGSPLRASVSLGRWTLIHTIRRANRGESLALYDRESDPLELRDVAAQNPAVVARLSALLERGRAQRPAWTVGEHEISSGLPATSAWADRYNCDDRIRQLDVIDTQPGYVYDSGRQDPGTASWGFLPRPGVTEWYVYPGCDDGRIVADVVRIDKGHTEGLEENVTERIIQLMLSAGR